MCMHPQVALDFGAASTILVITPIPDITNKKSHATPIDWSKVTTYKGILHQ
jgi:hypothetical protein